MNCLPRRNIPRYIPPFSLSRLSPQRAGSVIVCYFLVGVPDCDEAGGGAEAGETAYCAGGYDDTGEESVIAS